MLQKRYHTAKKCEHCGARALVRVRAVHVGVRNAKAAVVPRGESNERRLESSTCPMCSGTLTAAYVDKALGYDVYVCQSCSAEIIDMDEPMGLEDEVMVAEEVDCAGGI